MTRTQRKIDGVPQSTYRVQLTPKFGFAAAADIVPYLSQLGISDLYCSPILTARPGSTHGYDVVDPQHLNPELGGHEDFDLLVRALRDHRMGLLLDIVPNHMAASSENPWWLDVLENGPSSRYADYFDIEWDPSGPGGLANRVLLPVLGGPYGETLENGEIQLEPDQTGYHLRYYDIELPLATASYNVIIGLRADEIEQAVGSESKEWKAYSRLLSDVARVPSAAASAPHIIEQRLELRRRLESELPRLRRIPAIERELEIAVATINGVPGDPRSFDILDQIVAGQAYRLAFWQLAHEQINYRRFFDINDLISMHVENDEVFQAMHERALRLVHSGEVTGLRIDHVDGLWDPHRYLIRLQRALAQPSEPEVSETERFVVVEKILSGDERLPDDWPVAGTTGYEFMNVLNGLMVDSDGLNDLNQIYQRIVSPSASFTEMVYQAKIRVLEESFAANVQAISVALGQIADQDRHGRDLTFESIRQTVVEVTAALPVYRTYVNGSAVNESDQRWIETAIDSAMIHRPDLRHTLAFFRRVLLLQVPPYLEDTDRDVWLNLVMRWQQLTGPAMAKGNEDTALYQYNRLLSLNEVGGQPESTGVSVDEWHDYVARRQERWPHTLNSTSTHDTKRSEDVRARIDVLSELPDEWADRVARWQELNAGNRPVRNGIPIPDANVELQIYQTMLGAWPLEPAEIDQFLERLKAYMIKASREAKIYTSWTDIDSVYENALLGYIETLFDPELSEDFLEDFNHFQTLVAPAGAINSLSQTLVKLTAPGVPDTYQGSEIWDLSLVDPDNRRPVNYELRRRFITQFTKSDSLDRAELSELVENWRDGRIKLFLTRSVLQLRQDHADLFTHGDYTPCQVGGSHHQRIVAYARSLGTNSVIVVAPRLTMEFVRDQSGLNLSRQWGDTYIALPDDRWTRLVGAFDDEHVPIISVNGEPRVFVRDVLSNLPFGLLNRTV